MKKDYDCYRFSIKEYFLYGVVYLALGGGISWLFYHSFWPMLLILPGFPLFLREQKKRLIRQQKTLLLAQFLTGIQAVSNGLSAGYSVENAMEEAFKETMKVYGEDGIFTEELGGIVRKLKLNSSLETLLEDFGKRSHLEDIENFGEVFAVARRSGGDLNLIIRNTAESISQKARAQQEIAVSLAAKKMEQNVMSLIPLLILFYVDLAAPEFLEGLYHNSFGIGMMSVSLVIYLLAFLWGRRLVQIEV